MVFVTGGNGTCFGTCTKPEQAFNGSVALLSATPNPPNLAYLNCDQDGVLCNAWSVSPPRVLHLQLPQPLLDQSTPASTVRSIYVNRTSITAPEVAGRVMFGVIDHVGRATIDGQEGWGLFEHGALGRHDPSGFADWFTLAP